MKLPRWFTPYRRHVLRWLVLRDTDIPRSHERTAVVRKLLRKRVVSRRDGEFVLTEYGAKLLKEIEERKI